MNNLNNKIQEITKTINKRKSEIVLLEDNNNLLTQERNELQEKSNKIVELLSMILHYKKVGGKLCVNDKKFNLMKRKQVFQFLFYVCATIFGLGEFIALSSIVILFGSIFVESISINFLLISLVNCLISGLACYIGKKFEAKSQMYSKKATQNLEIFGDYIYDAKRISETLRINEQKVKNILTQIKENDLQIENKNKKIMDLEKIIEEIDSYKSIYDDVIDSIYEDNMPTELKKKISNTLNQESGKILAKSLFK